MNALNVGHLLASHVLLLFHVMLHALKTLLLSVILHALLHKAHLECFMIAVISYKCYSPSEGVLIQGIISASEIPFHCVLCVY